MSLCSKFIVTSTESLIPGANLIFNIRTEPQFFRADKTDCLISKLCETLFEQILRICSTLRFPCKTSMQATAIRATHSLGGVSSGDSSEIVLIGGTTLNFCSFVYPIWGERTFGSKKVS